MSRETSDTFGGICLNASIFQGIALHNEIMQQLVCNRKLIRAQKNQLFRVGFNSALAMPYFAGPSPVKYRRRRKA